MAGIATKLTHGFGQLREPMPGEAVSGAVAEELETPDSKAVPERTLARGRKTRQAR